jgi:hypothetical protein
LACSPRSFLGKRDVGLVPALLWKRKMIE